MRELWILVGAVAGAVLSVPVLYGIPLLLWRLLFPRRTEERARAAPELMASVLLFGAPVGASTGAACAALLVGLPHAAAYCCLAGGVLAAVGSVGLLVARVRKEPGHWTEHVVLYAEGLAELLTPWRGGWLLWALGLIAWGARLLRA